MTHFIYITLFGTLSRSTYMFHSTSFNFFPSGSLYLFLFHSTKMNIIYIYIYILLNRIERHIYIYIYIFCVNSWWFKLNAYCTFFIAGLRQKTLKKSWDGYHVS